MTVPSVMGRFAGYADGKQGRAEALRQAMLKLKAQPEFSQPLFWYWSRIGKVAAENPDLAFSVIRDILIADQEEPVGEYQSG